MDIESVLSGLALLVIGATLIVCRRSLGAALGRDVGDSYRDASLLNRERAEMLRDGLRDEAGRKLMSGFSALAGAILGAGGGVLLVLGVWNP